MRQPLLLPESLPANDIDSFIASLGTHRDRAMVLAMLLGGLRSAEVRGLLLADVDMGRRRLRVIGKGGKVGGVPVERGRIRFRCGCIAKRCCAAFTISTATSAPARW
ncbi:tyrosine-type recombinase/integrase [Mycobacterium riyadhense]|uniref:tyrosine-type recombinase/integrase n=1 Tax=Mycobacterium riyadhense TaxID=486698 RepID=UPI0020950459|nr:tyrosine-type recombinase/integrase [Mycobacterium riyadhense]